jgi:hypothetical protein
MTPYEFEVLARKMTLDHEAFTVLVRNDFTTNDHGVQLIITKRYTIGVSEFVNLENISKEAAQSYIEHSINKLEKRKNQLDAAMKLLEGSEL